MGKHAVLCTLLVQKCSILFVCLILRIKLMKYFCNDDGGDEIFSGRSILSLSLKSKEN